MVCGLSFERCCSRKHLDCSACSPFEKRSSASGSRCTDEYAIRVSRLSHKFCDKEVLGGVNLTVPRGSLHILAGANGCGKSTLLRILGQIISKQCGTVQVDEPVGVVLQNPDHQIIMPTVAAEVAFGLGRFRLPRHQVEQLIMDALCAVQLEDFAHVPTNTLSGGQKQRVAIAGALAQNPKVLLLDELTTFLDDEGQRLVMRAVKTAVEGPRRVTALWVTHRYEELEFADMASFMEGGKIKLSGTPKQVLNMMQ